MKRPFIAVALGTSSILLGACSQPTEPQEPPAPQASSTSAPHHPSPLDPLLNTREKARSVEQTLREHDARRRKAIEAATGG